MSETNIEDKNDSEGVGSELVLDLNFVPDWAKKPPGHSIHETQKRRRDSRPNDRRPRSGYKPGRPAAGRHPRKKRESQPRKQENVRRDHRPRERANVEVKFLPEQGNLATIVKKVATSNRAYPLVNIANLFVSNEGACNVKVEVIPESEIRSFFQCRACKSLFRDRENLESHLRANHLDDYFDHEEETGEPPKGAFVCVAKCGLSGTLLGPPNHHSYSQKLQDTHAAGFSHMPLEKYKEHIEMVRDEETINQWKEESRTQTLYRLKESSEEQAEAMDRAAAEACFMKKMASPLVNKTKKAILPLSTAKSLSDKVLANTIADAWLKEKRFPMSLMFALRSAFRHMHLHVFKVGDGKGANFVSNRKPAPMDKEHVVDDIASILKLLEEKPGCSKRELAEALYPGADRDSEEVAHLLSRVSWLIEKGHVIEFFDGKLSAPLQGGKRMSH